MAHLDNIGQDWSLRTAADGLVDAVEQADQLAATFIITYKNEWKLSKLSMALGLRRVKGDPFGSHVGPGLADRHALAGTRGVEMATVVGVEETIDSDIAGLLDGVLVEIGLLLGQIVAAVGNGGPLIRVRGEEVRSVSGVEEPEHVGDV